MRGLNEVVLKFVVIGLKSEELSMVTEGAMAGSLVAIKCTLLLCSKFIEYCVDGVKSGSQINAHRNRWELGRSGISEG